MDHHRPVALTIAGSDPSGGAGLQADLKTFHQHGVYGMSVVTLVTVQNTRQVSAVEVLDPRLVVEQIDAVIADIPPAAVKIGALGRADVIAAVAARVAGLRVPMVVDPVMVSKHGAALLADDAVDALCSELLPLATLVTPNLPEAARLAGFDVCDRESMERACSPAGVLVASPTAVYNDGGRGRPDTDATLGGTASAVTLRGSAGSGSPKIRKPHGVGGGDWPTIT
jgi:hydroxymethylpyrimidine/phosphomethylpyrimidine kinase